MAKQNKVKKRETVDQILDRLSERMFPDKFGALKVTLSSQEADGDGVLHNLLYGDENYPVRALVEAGADVNLAGNKGFTPLHVAAWRGNWEMSEFLLAAGAKADVTCLQGKTPAEVAEEMGFPACGRMLR